MYRYGSLGNDGPAVHFGTHEVYRAARHFYPTSQRALMRIEALERWQQRGMDINHPIVPQAHKVRRHQAHETSERDEVCVGRQKRLVQLGFKSATRRKNFMIDGERGDALRLGPGEPGSIGAVGNHSNDLGRICRGARGLDQAHHIGAAARYQDRRAKLFNLGHGRKA